MGPPKFKIRISGYHMCCLHIERYLKHPHDFHRVNAMTQSELALVSEAFSLRENYGMDYVIYMFTVSRDGTFSNMLRNDPKVEFKKGILINLAGLILSYWNKTRPSQ